MNFFRKYRDFIGLGFLATIFFVVYLFLYTDLPKNHIFSKDPTQTPPFIILNQPDEVVNYTFVRRLVFWHAPQIAEPLSFLAENQVHPRSTTVVEGSIVPIGFPGFIVLTSIFTFLFTFFFSLANFNIFALSFTPLLASLTPVFFYGFLKKIWNRRVAALSAVLLFFVPAWWYYGSRPFQHNIAFVFFLVVSLFFLVYAWEAKKYRKILMGLGAGSLFLSLYIRPVEFLWIAIALFLVYSVTRAGWKRSDLAVFVSVGMGALVLFFSTQSWFYGSIFGTGYIKPLPTGESASFLTGTESISFLRTLFAPFGFDALVILKNSYHYLWRLFSPWGTLTILGIIFFLTSEWKNFFTTVSAKKIYTVVYVFVTIFFVLYYGSWGFFDNLAQVFSIGSSHVRYFLPIYVGALPFVSITLLWFFSQTARFVRGLSILLFFFVLLQSGQVVYASFEGLDQIKKTVENYYSWRNQVYREVPEDAIIVTQFADKYLYPERKIIPGFTEPERFSAVLALLESGYRVYWFDPAVQVVNLQSQLSVLGLSLASPMLSIENLELREILRQ